MAWFKRMKGKKVNIPDALWIKCVECAEILYNKEMQSNLKVCPKCQHHFRMTAWERIHSIVDHDSFQEYANPFTITDPLNFPEYKEKFQNTLKKTELPEAVLTGDGKIGAHRTALGVTDFSFMAASMGSVMGEQLTLLVEKATEQRLPLIIFSSSGGARMQEGILSLMQMAKISAALAYHSEKHLPYISVLTDPTTGGVTASFAMLGDVNIAEPKALICFAGPQVIEQTIRQRLPKGFQKSEFLLEHGMIDMVLQRKDLRATLEKLLNYFCHFKPFYQSPSEEPLLTEKRTIVE
jgi:acetyl-CoA carboxylase carboxyl transferase subunit beta